MSEHLIVDTRQWRRWPAERVDRPPEYELMPPDIDTLPIGTFLIVAETAYKRVPYEVMRVVRPNDTDRYRAQMLRPAGRLLYVFWLGGKAMRKLHMWTAGKLRVRHIVQPGEQPAYDTLDAFKILCDTRRASSDKPPEVKPTLLIRAMQSDLT